MAAILVAFPTLSCLYAEHSRCLSDLQGWLLSSAAVLHGSTFVLPQIARGSGGDLVAELLFPFHSGSFSLL